MTAAERPAHERLRIEGEWLVEDVGRHTCGTGPDGHYGAHEPGCGLVPLMRLADLDEQMRARSRFAARTVGSIMGGQWQAVELYAGERYEHPGGRGGPRVPVAVVDLSPEQAADLVLALGEPEWKELPEGERPPRGVFDWPPVPEPAEEEYP